MTRKLVLVVDDEIDIVEIWQEVIEDLGHKVLTAYNGNDAVSLLKAHQFDLIITDMNMPGSDGMVILKHVANAERKPKIIVSSGFSEYEKLVSKFDIDKFMLKPFQLENEINYLAKLLQ
ncbi:MAG: response regulator [Flavobacteriales bacterium]|nr:response regulator [Flavobacteriales bacterium]